MFLELNGIFYYVIVYGNVSLFKVEECNGVLFFYVKILFYWKGVFCFWIKGVLYGFDLKRVEINNKGWKIIILEKFKVVMDVKEIGIKKYFVGYEEVKKFLFNFVLIVV